MNGAVTVFWPFTEGAYTADVVFKNDAVRLVSVVTTGAYNTKLLLSSEGMTALPVVITEGYAWKVLSMNAEVRLVSVVIVGMCTAPAVMLGGVSVYTDNAVGTNGVNVVSINGAVTLFNVVTDGGYTAPVDAI